MQKALEQRVVELRDDTSCEWLELLELELFQRGRNENCSKDDGEQPW